MTGVDGIKGTACNAQQYQLSLPTHDNPVPLITCLTRGQAIGLALATGVAFLSMASLFCVFIWIARNYLWYRKNVPRRDWRLFNRPFDIYMAAILGLGIFQALGHILNVRWIQNGIVATGPYCTAQGVIQQFGKVSVGLSILILTVHTFVTAMWRVGANARRLAVGLVFLALCFVTLLVSIGASTHRNYDVPTPFWCWVSPRYPGWRLGGEYAFVWLALFASIMLYIPLYYWSEGMLSVDDTKWYKFHWHPHFASQNLRSEYTQRRATRRMLFYPLGYAIVVLPLSAVRWSLYENKKVPTAVLFFAAAMWNLEGLINVLLLILIRPQLLLLSRPKRNLSVHVSSETEIPSGIGMTPKMPGGFDSELALRPLKECVLVLDHHGRHLSPSTSYSQSP